MQPSQRWYALAIIIAFVILSVTAAFTLLPQPDEAAYANPGYNLDYNGYFGMTVYEVHSIHMPVSVTTRIYSMSPFYFVITAVLYKLVGFGLGQVRLLSVVFGLVGIISWYVIVRRLCGSVTAGLVAMAAVAVDYFYVLGAAHGRMDMTCAGLGAACLASYLELRQRSLWIAVFVSHVFATMSIVTHPVGLLYWLALVFLILKLDRKALSWRVIVAGAAPCVAGMALWGAFILKDVPAFRDQMQAELGVLNAVFDEPGLSSIGPIRSLQLELKHRYLAPYGLLPGSPPASRIKAIVLAAYLAAVAAVFLLGRLRRQKGLLELAVLTLIAAAYLTFVSPSKYAYYLPFVTMFLAATYGAVLCAVDEIYGWKSRGIIAGLLIVGGIQVTGLAYKIHQDPYHHAYLPVIEVIKANTTARSVVIGTGELWFGLAPDRYIIHDQALGAVTGSVPRVFVMDSVFEQLFEAARAHHSRTYDHIKQLLNTSQIIYQNEYYKVYLNEAAPY